jgi:hypothetical protein
LEIYYQNIVDEKPVKVTIIQYSSNRKRVEIIRNNRIKGRKTFAGFWVNVNELIKM